MRQLISTVHVVDGDGTSHVFKPGDELPAWAFEKVTNPKAFVDVADTGDVDPEQPATTAVPPRSGTGSGYAAWAAYAIANEVDPRGTTKRDEIIALLDAADIPTKQ